ncbi:hypothetical protein ONA91_23540 [Micromonospora sp. DR5-3]|nr:MULTISPECIES: hypothetical protein [unclassified Micromonospora]MCW3817429.1 hypothetical protein [Micromonospora sp. DR5-3]
MPLWTSALRTTARRRHAAGHVAAPGSWKVYDAAINDTGTLTGWKLSL